MLVYCITSDTIGNKDPDLGGKLMSTFITKLLQADQKPTHLLLMERGVKLLLPEFAGIDALKILEQEMGVEILACQTCLDFYDIRNKIVAGKVSNMPTIIDVMHQADKVINL